MQPRGDGRSLSFGFSISFERSSAVLIGSTGTHAMIARGKPRAALFTISGETPDTCAPRTTTNCSTIRRAVRLSGSFSLGGAWSRRFSERRKGPCDAPLLLAIDIGLDPTLVSIGSLTLSWHGLLAVIGIVAGVSLSLRFARRAGLDVDETELLAAVGVVGGIVGARLFYLMEHWQRFRDDWSSMFLLTEGGITLYGGLLGGVAAGLAFALARGLPVLRLLDVAAPGMILGQAIGRLGDLINGEHLGTAAGVPWAVRYTNPETLGELGKAVHPTAGGYELLGDLIILGVLLLGSRLWNGRQGLRFAVYVVCYAVLRAALSPYRLDERELSGLPIPQLISLFLFVVGALLMIWTARRPAAAPAEPGGTMPNLRR